MGQKTIKPSHIPAPENSFTINRPSQDSTPIVLASPHSGSIFPETFLQCVTLPANDIRQQLEDSFVDQLFDFAPELGCPLIKGEISRAYIDLNRAINDIDPTMFNVPLPADLCTRPSPSLRVQQGLGLLPCTLNDGRQLYKNSLSIADLTSRIKHVYTPYHTALQELITSNVKAFGFCVLIDCHSMPSDCYETCGQKTVADFVLGTRYGKSCDPFFAQRLTAEINKVGFSVSQNNPFAGGFTTTHYGKPAENVHVVQLEINRQLYMDEVNLVLTDSFFALKTCLKDIIQQAIRKTNAFSTHLS